MRGYSSTKSHSFQFENSFHEYPNSSGHYGDSGDNLYKILCSWLNLREFISKGSVGEVDKIFSVFTAIFHADKQKVKKQKKNNFKDNSHIVKIDLDKIDTNLNLSNKQKIRLKQILNQIKYQELENKSMKKENKRSEKSVMLRKTKKTVGMEKGKTRRTQSVGESIDRRRWQGGECKDCKLCTKEGRSYPKRNHKRSTTTITPSEERIFKTLMHLDRSCCGDSFKTLFDSKGKRTYVSQTQNINIENLEFKYIEPTCLVQYSGIKKKLAIDVLQHPRSKFHLIDSISSLPVRTSSKQFMTNTGQDFLKDGVLHKAGCVPPFIDETDEPFERKGSTYHQGDTLGEFDYDKNLELLKSFCDEDIKSHPDENLKQLKTWAFKDPSRPTFDKVDNKDNALESCSLSENDINKEKTSKYKKLKIFAKKCLCLGRDKNKSTNMSKYEKKGKDYYLRKSVKKINSPNVTVTHSVSENVFLSRKKRSK